MKQPVKVIKDNLKEMGLVWHEVNDCKCDVCGSDKIIEVPADNDYKICINCGNNNLDWNKIQNYLISQKPQIETNEVDEFDVFYESYRADEVDSIKPQGFNEIYGNETIVRDLQVMIESSKNRNEALENILFFGPPGLGKTTLASVIATERGAAFTPTMASILKKDDIVDILYQMTPHEILFIDEIHDLNKSLALVLYTAMEDNYVDVVNDGSATRIDLPDFTVIGATTNPGKLLPAMRSRFGNKYTLELYSEDVLYNIIAGTAQKLNIGITIDAAQAVASRSRGTPRNAISLLKKARSYADVYNNNFQFENGFIGSNITIEIANMAFEADGIDKNGLNRMDREYLKTLNELGVTGAGTIAASMGDTEDIVKEMVEPWLMLQGYIRRTKRGRKITEKGKSVL